MMSRLHVVIGAYSFTIAMSVFALFSHPAQAEWYLAGQGGVAFGGNLKQLDEVPASGAGAVQYSNLALHASPLYGGKVGYYFDDPAWRWLGFEMEAYTSTQHIKQQGLEVTQRGVPPSSQVISDKTGRVTTWAPISMMVRYQIGPVEPYFGVGLSLSFLHFHDAATDTTTSSNANVGFIGKAGLRWRVTEHLAVFGEWKYNQFSFSFDQFLLGSASSGGDGRYGSHIAVGGIGWHF
ncbi:MAG: outer membrane beta-barrel protein [Nitrospira sp.]